MHLGLKVVKDYKGREEKQVVPVNLVTLELLVFLDVMAYLEKRVYKDNQEHLALKVSQDPGDYLELRESQVYLEVKECR